MECSQVPFCPFVTAFPFQLCVLRHLAPCCPARAGNLSFFPGAVFSSVTVFLHMWFPLPYKMTMQWSFPACWQTWLTQRRSASVKFTSHKSDSRPADGVRPSSSEQLAYSFLYFYLKSREQAFNLAVEKSAALPHWSAYVLSSASWFQIPTNAESGSQ